MNRDSDGSGEVSTARVSGWDKDSIGALGNLLIHPLTRMVLTSASGQDARAPSHLNTTACGLNVKACQRENVLIKSLRILT